MKSELDLKMENLRSQMARLRVRKMDIMDQIQHAETFQGEKRKREVELWLKEVEELNDVVESIERAHEEGRLQLEDHDGNHSPNHQTPHPSIISSTYINLAPGASFIGSGGNINSSGSQTSGNIIMKDRNNS